MKPPKPAGAKKSSRVKRPPRPEYVDEEETEALLRENEKLISQLSEFTGEMESKLEGLKKKDNLDNTMASQKSN